MTTFGTRLGFTNIAAGTNPRSVNIALASGTGRKLVVVAANETTGAATIDSATFDGTSITSFSSRTASSMRERWFYYDIPDGKGAATYAIAVTLSSDAGALSVAAWITDGDTAGEPRIATVTVADGEASKAVSIDAVNGDALLTAYFDPTSANTASAASSQVTLGNSNNISTSGFRAHKYDATGDATESVTVTWTPSTSTGGKIAALVNTTPLAAGPSIDTQPTAVTTVLAGPVSNNPATFTVAATTSGGSLVYDWELEDGVGSGVYANLADGDGTTWTGQTSASCSATITATTLSGRRVRCNVTDDNGTTTTNAVALTIYAGTTIAQPAATDGSGVATAVLTTDVADTANGALKLITFTKGSVTLRTTARKTS